MTYRYSIKLEENMAKAVSHSLPVSRKLSTQVCRFVKGLPVAKAKKALDDVMNFKRAVPMFKHYKETAHKTGMAVGRYPIKACKAILGVIESAEANAQFKGLSTGNLIVYHASAQKGPTTRGQGRTGGHKKRTHVEIVLAANTAPQKKAQKPAAKVAQKIAPKAEQKTVPKQAATKPTTEKPVAQSKPAVQAKPAVAAPAKPAPATEPAKKPEAK